MDRPVIVLAIAMLLAAFGAARAATPDAASQVHRLGRGMNVLGYDPLWDDAAKARFRPPLFARIRGGGFQHVRVNLQAFAHMDAAGRLDPVWLAKLDGVIRQASQAGLMVILDEHDFIPCAADAASCRTRLVAFWAQIAARYRDAPDGVLFEILNEPHGQETPAVWNSLLTDALAEIRRSNPTRTIVIGPGNANGMSALDQLALPEDDRNIIVTVHYYEPIAFTHQGADWTSPSRVGLTGVTWGKPDERQAMAKDFDTIAGWAKAHRRPVLIGEFGAFEAADMASRIAWTAGVARDAEARGFAWSYWQFDGNFIAFDIARDAWVAPIHDALAPP